MENQNGINKWRKVHQKEFESEKVERPSLTYWQDAWRRFRKNKLAMVGFVLVIIITLIAIIVPFFWPHTYDHQVREFVNAPPTLKLYKVDDDNYFYLSNEYKVLRVSGEGVLQEIVKKEEESTNLYRIYKIAGREVTFDFSNKRKNKEKGNIVKLDGKEIFISKKMRNKTYILGTDHLGRDLFIRIVCGARISLFVAFVATLVNFFIGVFYGGIAGYMGGKVDNILMRIVDIISTVPLLLIVILLSVYMSNGIKTIIISFGLVYWVRMARLVRGQVLSLKEQEFVMAAKTIGASTWRILSKHLIPNAMGPIVVSMSMMIPNAIFTEAFLSFIGLGVSAPQASWGTITNEALQSIWTSPYQLIYPSIAICITILAFNFVGDGLRDALDPRLRK